MYCTSNKEVTIQTLPQEGNTKGIRHEKEVQTFFPFATSLIRVNSLGTQSIK